MMIHLAQYRHLSLILIALTISMVAHADDSDELVACESHISLPAGYEFVELTEDCDYTEGLTPVIKADKYGYANKHGKIIIDARFDAAAGFDDKLAPVMIGNKWGYIHPNGQFAIHPQFADAWGFWEGRAKVKVGDKYGYIDKTGKVVIAATYDDAGNWFANGLARVQKSQKWGYIDKSGTTKIAFKYATAEDFSEGVAVVGQTTGNIDNDGNPIYEYGYINKSGKVVLPIKYDYASDFVHGMAMIIQDDELYFINTKGQRVEPDFLE